MPSEAEIEAAAVAIHKIGTSSFDPHALARAALSAASAVRSEPVAWIVTAADRVDYIFGDRDKAAEHGVPRRLYTSPVQTREDGIREAAKIAAERWRELDAQLAGGKILEHLQERVTGRAFEAQALEASILALLGTEGR